MIRKEERIKMPGRTKMHRSTKGIIWLLSFLLTLTISGCGNATPTSEMVDSNPQENFESLQETDNSEEMKETDNFEEAQETENSDEPRFVPEHGLQVIGPNICDADGNVFQLRGISTHGIQWYPQYINQELFTQMHDEWKCNVIRIANYVEEFDGYCAGGDRDWLDQLIDEAVTYASNAQMYVIIDWHVMREGDPRLHQDDAIDFFDRMSKQYADNPYVLYEICNEPNGKGINWDPIYEYADQVIPVIRANSPYSLIIVGTPMYSAAPSEPLRKELPYENLAYAYHFYAKSHRESRQEDLKKAYDAGVPILVSEFGTVANSGSGTPDDEMADKWIEILDERGIGYICWNLSNNAETSALIVEGCEKTSGFTADELKPEGQWLLNTLEKYND